MARLNIIRCDRCNNEIRNNGGSNQITSQPVTIAAIPRKDLDLCNGCIKQFERFINNADVGSGNSTFEEFELPCTHRVPCASPCGDTVFDRVYQ